MTSNQKPALVAIFAHPDDESFGPGGTLALFSKTHDVYLICVTPGELGDNHHDGDIKNLAKIRCEELENSAKILGIKKVFCLGYNDGYLSNKVYQNIASDIRNITDKIKPEIILTFDEKGVSGHIDHIAVSMIAHFVFYKVDYAKELMLFCESEQEAAAYRSDYFVYVPTGYDPNKVDKVINISSVYRKKVDAMKAHQSQMKDMMDILEVQKNLPKQELFNIKKK